METSESLKIVYTVMKRKSEWDTGNQSSPPFLWKGISFKHDDRVLKIGTDALLLATWIPKIVSSSLYILDVGMAVELLLYSSLKLFRQHRS
jgi:tRNA1(Val) A37 N6-methylase TrmN6